MTTWIYDDGGRAAFNYPGEADDCCVRAIAIASELSYRDVRRRIVLLAIATGVDCNPDAPIGGRVYNLLLHELGWRWIPTAGVPSHGRYVVALSRHLTVVIDGVCHDTWDSMNSGRVVEGYWRRAKEAVAS